MLRKRHQKPMIVPDSNVLACGIEKKCSAGVLTSTKSSFPNGAGE